jgi:hypothetical protein
MKATHYILGIFILLATASCGGNTSAPDSPPSHRHHPASDSGDQYATPVDSTTGTGAGANAQYHKTDSTNK